MEIKEILKVLNKNKGVINLCQTLTTEDKNKIAYILAKYDIQDVLIGDFNGYIQLFYIKVFGTNGRENSIKSSLAYSINELDNLEQCEFIEHPNILNIKIDNLDDIYYMLFGFKLK